MTGEFGGRGRSSKRPAAPTAAATDWNEIVGLYDFLLRAYPSPTVELSARADLCRRMGRPDDARDSCAKALQLVRLHPERRFLEKRIADLSR